MEINNYFLVCNNKKLNIQIKIKIYKLNINVINLNNLIILK